MVVVLRKALVCISHEAMNRQKQDLDFHMWFIWLHLHERNSLNPEKSYNPMSVADSGLHAG